LFPLAAHAFAPHMRLPSLAAQHGRWGCARAATLRVHSSGALGEVRVWDPSSTLRNTGGPRLRAGSRGHALRMQQEGQEHGESGHNGSTVPSEDVFRQAVKDTAIAVGAAVAFGAGIGAFEGYEKAVEYFTGYLLEESLSVDNLFVFLLLFEYFQVPTIQQKKVLNYGIWGAVAMRAAFIGAGILAIEKFRGVLVGFAGILLYSSFKILTTAGADEEEAEDVSENAIVKFVNRFLESSPSYDGDKFWTEQDGRRLATPLLVVLICVELSDVLFAVDSIPAVFGVTEDPFIVFTSNVFAIASLRALYSVLAKLAKDLEYLDTAVGAVLGFIGCKLIAEYLGFEVSELASLGVVASMLGIGVGTSLHVKRKQEIEEEL